MNGMMVISSSLAHIVHCEVTQNMKHPSYYLPKRNTVGSAHKPLDWVSPVDPIECWLPSPTYIDCIKNDYKVRVIEDTRSGNGSSQKGNVGVYWEEKHFIFRNYMTTFMKMKIDEDALPLEKRNNAKWLWLMAKP
jgi:hypothetical protein